jgi:hypothetical protein
MMKRAGLLSLCGLLACLGCGQSGTPATLQSAHDFHDVFLESLKQIGEVQSPSYGTGNVGNVFMEDWTYVMSNSKLPPKMLSATALAAWKKWGKDGAYEMRGHSEGGCCFSGHFGNRYSHAFIEIVAFTEDADTNVLVLVRVQGPPK